MEKFSFQTETKINTKEYLFELILQVVNNLIPHI